MKSGDIMKRGTNCVLPIEIDIDLETVEKIKFLFVQDINTRLMFEYPSERAVLGEDGLINLIWNIDETNLFRPAQVQMDTYITLKESMTNPETSIVRFVMSPTLFYQSEIEGPKEEEPEEEPTENNPSDESDLEEPTEDTPTEDQTPDEDDEPAEPNDPTEDEELTGDDQG